MTIKPKLKHLPLVFAALALAVPSLVFANADVAKLISNPNNWAHPQGNFQRLPLGQARKSRSGKCGSG